MILTNQIERSRNKPLLENNLSIPSLSHIKEIRDKVQPVVAHYHSKPSISFDYPQWGLDLERSIITDAVTFLELKFNQHQKSIIHRQDFEQFVQKLDQTLLKKRINFNETVHASAKLLNIPNLPDYTEAIHNNPNFADNKILRTELDLFINRGNFHWEAFDRSNFASFLSSSSATKLNENESINCWEAMLYSLIRGDALKKSDVAKLYHPKFKLYEVLQELSNAFRWETSKNITNKDTFKKAALYNPYFVEVSSRGTKYLPGLFHDMISSPNSTDKMLQVLASGKYEGGPDHNMTVYSHWTKWTDSRLGIASNDSVLNIIDKQDLHIIPLHVFIRKFPSISQRVMENLSNSLSKDSYFNNGFDKDRKHHNNNNNLKNSFGLRRNIF